MVRKLFIALFATLILAALPVHAEEGGGESSGPYLKLDPPFVVNLRDGRQMRFMQVKAQVEAKDSEVRDAIKENMPPIRDALLLLLTSQTMDQMRTTPGREKLRAEALTAVKDVVKEFIGKSDVDAIYFTDFVIQ